MVSPVRHGLALLLSRFDIHSLFDVSIELAGCGASDLPCLHLGMFSRAPIGGGCDRHRFKHCPDPLIWSFQLVHPYFYLGISIMLCIVIGYVGQPVLPRAHARPGRPDHLCEVGHAITSSPCPR